MHSKAPFMFLPCLKSGRLLKGQKKGPIWGLLLGSGLLEVEPRRVALLAGLLAVLVHFVGVLRGLLEVATHTGRVGRVLVERRVLVQLGGHAHDVPSPGLPLVPRHC